MRLGQSTFEFLFVAGLIVCIAVITINMYSEEVLPSQAMISIRLSIDEQFSAAELSHPSCSPITFTRLSQEEDVFIVHSSNPKCTSTVLDTTKVEKEVCIALGCEPESPCSCNNLFYRVVSE